MIHFKGNWRPASQLLRDTYQAIFDICADDLRLNNIEAAVRKVIRAFPKASTNYAYDAALYALNELMEGKLLESFSSGKLPKEMFQGIYHIDVVEIPANISIIEDYAFYNCFSILEVKLPASITEIGEGAFRSCRNLKRLEYAGSMQQFGDIHLFDDWIVNTFSLDAITCSDGELEAGK